jgi:hypothetical protein
MNQVEILHLVPDGPEPYLAIPGPLSVSLRISQLFPSSRVITASQDLSKMLVDERIKNAQVTISRKFQYRKKLATSFSPLLCIKLFLSPRNSLLHFHYSRSFTSILICALLNVRRDIPLLLHTHGSVKANGGKAKRFYDFFITRNLFRRATFLVALQENEKNHLLSLGAKRERLVIIPNMVQPLSSAEVLSLQKDMNLVPQILFVGHLRASKQVIRFFEIASQDKFKHCKFVIAGPDGGDLELLLHKIESNLNGNIQYLGSLNWKELSAAYQSSDIILSTAIDAPFDLSFLDGIARGCLGVASKHLNNWEELEQSGVLIAEDSSIESLSHVLNQALGRINSNESNKLGNSRSILRSYGEAAILPLWQQLYLEMHET